MFNSATNLHVLRSKCNSYFCIFAFLHADLHLKKRRNGKKYRKENKENSESVAFLSKNLIAIPFRFLEQHASISYCAFLLNERNEEL